MNRFMSTSGNKGVILAVLTLLVISLAGGLLLTGCSGITETPTEMPVEFKIAFWGPPELPISQVAREWADMIEEQSEGRIKFTFYWSESLVKSTDTWKAIETGVTDIGYYVLGFGNDPRLHALNGFTSLPFMGWKDMSMATDIYHQMLPAFPELEAEFENTKLLWLCNMPPTQIHSVNHEIRVPADYNGVKVIASGILSDIAVNAGASSITMAPPDWGMSLERGLVESVMVHWPAIVGYGLVPEFPYHTDFGEAGVSMAMHGMWINELSWNDLAPDLQQIILNNSPWIQEKYMSIDKSEITKAINQARELDHTFTVLSDEEIEQWKQTAESVTIEWIEEMESMGLPGQAVYDEAKHLISEYRP